MKLITTVHGWTWDTYRTRLYYHIDRLCLSRYDRVIAVSPLLARQCLQAGVHKDRLTYLPNGIDVKEYSLSGGGGGGRGRSRDQARAEQGIPQDRIIIGVVGRLSVEKGVDRAIRMMPELRKSFLESGTGSDSQIELHLIGDGPERANLQRLARDLGLSEVIHFRGWQKDSRPLFETFDALLLPSHTEGMPNVVLEAMAMGVPVLATNVGGVGEMLDHGRCGVILNQDHATWPSRIAHLLDAHLLRAQITLRARERVEKEYHFQGRVDRELDIYDQLLGTATRSSRTSENASPLRRAA